MAQSRARDRPRWPRLSGARCGECKNQAFLPVRDRVVLDHLQGRQVAGVYPLLADETCWLLAVDFRQGPLPGACRRRSPCRCSWSKDDREMASMVFDDRGLGLNAQVAQAYGNSSTQEDGQIVQQVVAPTSRRTVRPRFRRWSRPCRYKSVAAV